MFVFHSNVCAMVQQGPDDRLVSVADCVMEWRVQLAITHVDIQPIDIEKTVNKFLVIESYGDLKWCLMPI